MRQERFRQTHPLTREGSEDGRMSGHRSSAERPAAESGRPDWLVRDVWSGKRLEVRSPDNDGGKL